jgi:cytochrome c biogenesis protein CcdA
VFGIDERIADLSGGAGLAVALAVALLLGLRHATDPDHLTAVSMIALHDHRRGARPATALGLAWGLGHASTLTALGLPVVLFGSSLPDALRRAAEVTIGAVIVGLAVRLLVRRHRGHLGVNAHAEALGRTPLAALAIGLLHGVGGSAAAGVLLVGALGGRAAGTLALGVFAAGTAVSMALVTAAFGHAIARGPVLRRVDGAVPVLGALSLLFGLWYAARALELVHGLP